MLLNLLKHAWRGWSRTGAHRLQALEQALDAEAQTQGELGAAHDYLEGVAAFMAKRAPNFTDR